MSRKRKLISEAYVPRLTLLHVDADLLREIACEVLARKYHNGNPMFSEGSTLKLENLHVVDGYVKNAETLKV